MSEPTSIPSVPRTVIMAAFSILAAYAFYSFDRNPPVGVLLACFALVVAPFLNRIGTLGPQLIARAIWWQAALLGLLISVSNATHHGPEPKLMMIGAFVALGVAGRSGLANHSPAFLPVAFRRTLIASLVLALADFQALLLYGAIFLEESSATRAITRSLPFFVAALAMGVSIFGLYRLKMWGLVACIAANVVVAACALLGVFDLPDMLVFGLTATAVIQLFLPAPIIRQILRTRRLA